MRFGDFPICRIILARPRRRQCKAAPFHDPHVRNRYSLPCRYWLPATDAQRLIPFPNDEIAKAVTRFPTRFTGLDAASMIPGGVAGRQTRTGRYAGVAKTK